MVNLIFISFYAIVFFILTWRRFEWGLFLFFLFLPTYLIRFQVGPLPSTVLEVMLLLLVAIWFFKDKNYTKIFRHFVWFWREHKILSLGILLFLLGATISVFTALDIKKALGEWRAFYIEPLLLFFVLTSYSKNLSDEKRTEQINHSILLPLIISGLATSVLAIYQHFTGWLVPHAFWANRNTYRVTAWYGFPNAVGLFLAPLIPVALFLIKQQWNRTKKIFHFPTLISILFIVCSLPAIFFAKGSGPLLGVAAGIGVLMLCYKKTRWISLALGILGVIGIILLPTEHALKQELLAKNYSGQLRRDIWSETVELLKDRPLTGAGIASYEERILPYRADKWIEVFHHPHNIFLTIWINTGLIGLSGFFFILIWFFHKGIQYLKINTDFILASMAVILVMGLVDSPYIKNDLSILFWLFPFLLLQKVEHKNISL